MRFKKRSKVEVLSQKEAPAGAWRCAVIVSGNGHTYSVSYDWSGKDSQADMQRVSRKDIRPCPPPVQRVESWAVGDVVELFDDGFWKMAMVLKVLDENYYLARLLGSSEELRVHKYRIRARQLWNNDRWVVIGKGPDNQMSSQVPQMNAKIKLPSGNDCLPPMYNISCQDSHSVSSGLLKRASPDSSSIEGCSRKVRAFEKGCERQCVFAGSPSYLLKKVDAVAYPRENMGEKYMHTSFMNRTTGCFEKEREKLNGVISCFVERSSELNDSNSDACSVGSCSVISSSSNKLSSHDADTLSSDAETFCCCEDVQENFSLPLKEDVAAGIHRLEMNAYRSTLVAMHASGSLSWDQEALLTNLRISLHISNDEHLMEPKNKDKASSLKEQHVRYFTLREVDNLHSLPEDFQFPQHISLRQRYALLGNSLSIAVVAPLLKSNTYLPDHHDYSKTPQCSRCRCCMKVFSVDVRGFIILGNWFRFGLEFSPIFQQKSSIIALFLNIFPAFFMCMSYSE